MKMRLKKFLAGACLSLLPVLAAAAAPVISSVVPASASMTGGDVITVTGSGFMATASSGSPVVAVGGAAATVLSYSDTQLQAVVPRGMASMGSSISVGQYPELLFGYSTFTYTAAVPTLVPTAVPGAGLCLGAPVILPLGVTYTVRDLDVDGTSLYTLDSSGLVRISDFAGNETGSFTVPNPLGWQRMAVDNAYIYIFDVSNAVISKYDQNGALILSWGSAGTAPGQFSSNLAAGIDAKNGYVYVADFYNDRIQKFDENGNFITAWGSTAGLSLARPYGVAVDGNDVWVTAYATFDSSYAEGNAVYRFDTNGHYIRRYGMPDGNPMVGSSSNEQTIAASCGHFFTLWYDNATSHLKLANYTTVGHQWTQDLGAQSSYMGLALALAGPRVVYGDYSLPASQGRIVALDHCSLCGGLPITATYTPSLTPTRTPCPACTVTVTSTQTRTSTPTRTMTFTPSYTATTTPTDCGACSATTTPTPCAACMDTATPTPTASPSPSSTFSASPTACPACTGTYTPTATVTATVTPSSTLTTTPTASPSPTLTLQATPSGCAGLGLAADPGFESAPIALAGLPSPAVYKGAWYSDGYVEAAAGKTGAALRLNATGGFMGSSTSAQQELCVDTTCVQDLCLWTHGSYGSTVTLEQLDASGTVLASTSITAAASAAWTQLCLRMGGDGLPWVAGAADLRVRLQPMVIWSTFTSAWFDDLTLASGACGPQPTPTASPIAVPGVAAGDSYPYPSPANGSSVHFAFTMPAAGQVHLQAVSAAGDLLSEIWQNAGAGSQSVALDISGYAPGIYYYRLELISNGSTVALPLKSFAIVR